MEFVPKSEYDLLLKKYQQLQRDSEPQKTVSFTPAVQTPKDGDLQETAQVKLLKMKLRNAESEITELRNELALLRDSSSVASNDSIEYGDSLTCYSVIKEYIPQHPDELLLNVGDQVAVSMSFIDGWSHGYSKLT
jgi:hypothetical protein